MAHQKPANAGVLSAVGGFLITVESLLLPAILGYTIYSVVTFVLCTVLGLISGLVVIVGGAGIYFAPTKHRSYGTIVAIASFVGLFAGGGFIVGSILGLVGGVWAATWKPKFRALGSSRYCPYCGSANIDFYNVCQNCGSDLSRRHGQFDNSPYYAQNYMWETVPPSPFVESQPNVPMEEQKRPCPHCNSMISAIIDMCPHCGRTVPKHPPQPYREAYSAEASQMMPAPPPPPAYEPPPAPEEDTRSCPNCGLNINVLWDVCPHCLEIVPELPQPPVHEPRPHIPTSAGSADLFEQQPIPQDLVPEPPSDDIMEAFRLIMSDPASTPPSAATEGLKRRESEKFLDRKLAYTKKLREWMNLGFDVTGLEKLLEDDKKEKKFERDFERLRKQIEG